MEANTPWEMLPSRQRSRSASRNSIRFAAQSSARGLPCERLTAVLTDRTSCITRGPGGWLDLPRGGLAPPIPCQLSWRALLWVIFHRHNAPLLAVLLPLTAEILGDVVRFCSAPAANLAARPLSPTTTLGQARLLPTRNLHSLPN